MESRENWNGLDGGTSSEFLGHHRSRDLLTDPLMRPTRIKKRAVLNKHAIEILLTKDANVIQTFASDATKESFTNRIHQGRLRQPATRRA